MQQEGIVAILGRRNPEVEPMEFVGLRIETIAPCLRRERRIGHGKIERHQTVAVLEIRRGQGVVLPDFRRGAVVQNHVHLGQRGCGVVHFLPVNGDAVRSFGGSLEQQRTGTTGGVVNRLLAAPGPGHADDLGHDERDFGRRVKLAFGFAGFRGEMPHQVFVCVAKNIVSFSTVPAKIERGCVEN